MNNLYKTRSGLLGFAILLTFSLFFSPSKVFAFTGEGAGNADDPYRITDCSKWLEMADDLDGNYIVDDDIDCMGVTYTPIGASGSPFTGSLDGGGWEISGVSITSGSGRGLFGYTNGSTIKNLDFASSTLSGSSLLGGVVADATGGVISNVHSTVNITSTSGSVGGLVGIGHGTLLIEKSSFNGTISADSAYVGGVISRLEGNMTINDSYAGGSIGNGGNSYMGGFAGAVLSGSPTISRSYAAMTFTVVDTYNGGFIGGFFGGTVIDSFSASDMTVGAGNLSGGMFGVGDGTSTNNYFDEFLADRSGCTGSGAAACSGVNTADATPSYFKNNSTNDPLDNWNFTSIWSTSVGNYPQLSQIPQAETQCELPTSTKTTIHLACDIQSVGDLGTIVWSGRYRLEGNPSWTSATLADSSTGVMDLSGLTTSTTYEVSLKYTSSLYGTSYWVNTEITTKSASTGGQGGGNNNDNTTTSQSSDTSSGYGPVNEGIFLASANNKTASSGSSDDEDFAPIPDETKDDLAPQTIEETSNMLRNILVAGGAIVFLSLAFSFFKPPAPTSGK